MLIVVNTCTNGALLSIDFSIAKWKMGKNTQYIVLSDATLRKVVSNGQNIVWLITRVTITRHHLGVTKVTSMSMY